MRVILHADQRLKAKPQRRELAGSPPRTVPIGKTTWTDVEPGKYSFSDYEVSKKVMYLLRHSQQVPREEDGACHFWRMKENLQSQFPQSIHWSDDRWKACLAAGGGGGNKKKSSILLILLEQLCIFRAIQGHSGRSLVDPSLQDNVIIKSNFFQNICHVGCAINLHSIIISGLIPGAVFFLPIDPRDKGLVDPMDKNHKDPDVIDFSVPRSAQYLHNAWKRHQDAVYWVKSILLLRKNWHSIRLDRMQSTFKKHFQPYCISQVVRMETGEVIYEKVFMWPRPPPKISLKHEWKGKLGSEHAQRPEVGQLSRSVPIEPTNSKSKSWENVETRC